MHTEISGSGADASDDSLATRRLLRDARHFRFSADGIDHTVYQLGQRTDPPLLLMPEMAGFAPGLMAFARRLAGSGFQVYVPWLFGAFLERAPFRNGLRLCISREFALLRAGTSAPVATWLRRLSARVSEENGGRNVGVIGMCLTGAFAIPLVIDPHVTAAVAAQPAIPCSFLFAAFGLRRPAVMRGLNVSDVEIEQARQRLNRGTAQILAVRSRADRLCPAEKLERLRDEFPVGLTALEYADETSRNALGDRPHALFTKEYRLAVDAPADHWSRRAFADLVAFFRTNLD